MLKTLQEIQQENRKLIIKACNPEFDPERFDYPAYQITLSKVLLALAKEDKVMQIIPQSSGKLDIYTYKEGFFSWDLTKETLESQSENTQRAINKLLNNE